MHQHQVARERAQKEAKEAKEAKSKKMRGLQPADELAGDKAAGKDAAKDGKGS